MIILGAQRGQLTLGFCVLPVNVMLEAGMDLLDVCRGCISQPIAFECVEGPMKMRVSSQQGCTN